MAVVLFSGSAEALTDYRGPLSVVSWEKLPNREYNNNKPFYL